MTQLYNWSADFKPRKSANIGTVVMGFEVVAESKTLANAEAFQALKDCGQNPEHYFQPKLNRRGKVERSDWSDTSESGTPAAAVSACAQPGGDEIQPAGVDPSVADAEPGHHEQLDQLYTMGESSTEEIPPGAFERVDPAPETDKQAEVTEVAKPNGDGSGDSVDQTEATAQDIEAFHAGMLAGLNAAIEALPIGGRLIREDIPESVYRPSTGFSTTNIKLGLTRSWRKMRAYMDGKAKEKKKQFSLGRSVHCKILQPSLYWDDFVVQPVNIGSRNSKAYKEWAATQGDREILTEEQYQDTLAMEASIMSEAGEWFSTERKSAVLPRCWPERNCCVTGSSAK